MKNQKSRRINRKQTKRNTIKRNTIKRKQNKKIVYNQKKMYGGDFNADEKEILKESLERFDFNEEELEKVMKILGYGGHHLSGDNLEQLTSQYEHLNKDEFMEWLVDEDNGYMHAVKDDGTDNEDEDDEDF
jgi:hypothetical protein